MDWQGAKKIESDDLAGCHDSLNGSYYIVKPFEALEWLARIETVLRRFGKRENVTAFKDLQDFLGKREVRVQYERIDGLMPERWSNFDYAPQAPSIPIPDAAISAAFYNNVPICHSGQVTGGIKQEPTTGVGRCLLLQ
ncbi:response regulator transcription factor [Shouchella clausii]|uniref:response regulator transcription factor n=1 Tax=Shouchella clausii TaxID=79880 RepID=UPI000BA69750|nr:response regulator transcription factor [Shouchella clausii]PAE93989.1 hypothetical protein CHH70_09330 [Shouchella clausii]